MLIVVALFFPYYIGAGFLAARRGGVASAVTTSAVTALTWLGIGVALALATLFLGALGGVAGGMIAKAIKSIQS
jgi:hypothetical protein